MTDGLLATAQIYRLYMVWDRNLYIVVPFFFMLIATGGKYPNPNPETQDLATHITPPFEPC